MSLYQYNMTMNLESTVAIDVWNGLSLPFAHGKRVAGGIVALLLLPVGAVGFRRVGVVQPNLKASFGTGWQTMVDCPSPCTPSTSRSCRWPRIARRG